MAQVAASVMQTVRKYLKTVQKHYRLNAAYLYGSHVKGKATRWSDIDLAIISPDFKEDSYEERLALLRLSVGIDDRIEPHPFKVEAFNPNDPLASEISDHGVRVA